MVAMAVSVLIVLGSLILLRYMVTVADTNRDKTVATLEVQYVGFWISEDLAQASSIQLGTDPGDADGFPLTIQYEDWEETKRETITYEMESMGDGLMRLLRHRTSEDYIGDDWVEDSAQSGTSAVAEYIVPWSESEETGTRCCRMEYDTQYDTMKSVVVEVEAQADRSEASCSYEVYPRAVSDWLPENVDGVYVGPACSGS
jgi:hypothetical protein